MCKHQRISASIASPVTSKGSFEEEEVEDSVGDAGDEDDDA